MIAHSSREHNALQRSSTHFWVSYLIVRALCDCHFCRVSGRETDSYMTLMPMNLRLDSADSFGLEEYRIYEGTIEVRRLARSSDNASDDNWQRLTHGQVAEHVKKNTVVAQWLRKRIGWQRLLLACTDPETLQEFGIPENTLDRYAA